MGNLIPEEIRKTIPPLYATEEQKDPIVYVKLFLEGWTWFMTEMSMDGDICFGYVVSPFASELGYFSLEEISEVKSSLGIGVERDLYFTPITLSEVKQCA